jgi:hypothetical protein
MNKLISSLKSTSLVAVLVITSIFVAQRFRYSHNNEVNGYNATSWDALGYYMYLPATFIYDDVKELKWFPGIDSTYHVSGGWFYQAIPLENGQFTYKYLSGVAIMESPFFAIGHLSAKITGAPQDGFSAPYQYAILFGALFWFFIGLFFLRKVLHLYFSEQSTALTLLLLCLCSNLIQYVSIDGGMSHAYIFPLYSLILWLTIRWHETPKWSTALLLGLLAGLAVISRPTELILIFIPILWIWDTQKHGSTKFQFLTKNPLHLAAVIGGGIIGILPQLLYWKYSTGSFIYDVGSKWFFLNPWWRVLFGPEKGWFLYTPIALLMVAGFFFMKKYPFRKAVLTFCLLNIWIIISWSDWKYGASYSTRALTQSYPVFALALACVIDRWFSFDRLKWMLPALGVGLIFLNFYQMDIYNQGILESFSPLLRIFK